MHGVDGLEFNARIDLLRADGYVRTTVHGYPPGDGEPELLFNSTSGPDADGKAVVRGAIRSDLSAYEVVEVRAHRGDRDPGCERPRREVHNEDVGPAACASVWIEPLVGT
jgi:hypothetical protein